MEVLILVCGLWVMILFLTILGMSLSDYFRGEGADESDETYDILDDFDGEEIYISAHSSAKCPSFSILEIAVSIASNM